MASESIASVVRTLANLCEITGTESRRQWLMLNGDFAEEACPFFASNPTLDSQRHSSVSLAVPLDEEVHGLLCAYLPTDESSRLPLHVNADFFPGSDRRRLLVEGPRGEWNRLALRAAARTLADHLTVLVDALSPTRLWQVLFAAHQAKDDAEELGLDVYWGSARTCPAGCSCDVDDGVGVDGPFAGLPARLPSEEGAGVPA